LAIFRTVTGVSHRLGHVYLHQFHQQHSLNHLQVLLEYLRDVAYRDRDGTLPRQKRDWLRPQTTCHPERVEKHLRAALQWATEGKPRDWETERPGQSASYRAAAAAFIARYQA
jgi:hypothetical protein